MAAKTPAKTPAKGGKLGKKYGPLPLKAWLGIAAGLALLLFLYLRHRNSAASGATGDAGVTDVASGLATISPQQAASAGTPQPNSSVANQLSPEVLDALGQIGTSVPSDYVTGTDLQSQLDSLNNDIAGQIAGITFQNPKVEVTVKGANVSPQTKKATAAPVKKTPAKNAAPSKTTPTKYYTLKKQVSLKKGQTLAYTPNKGYYAKSK